MNFKDIILFEDNHLLVVNKPAGVLAQGDQTGDDSLLELGKSYLIQEYNKPGKAFLGLVHRLDRPVSGILVYAKTSKAASRLSEQFRKKTTLKKYRALVQGFPPNKAALKHWLKKEDKRSRSVNESSGKYAELAYKKIQEFEKYSLVEVSLITGRHHQIRVQFSTEGYPLIGDFKYGSKTEFPNKAIALQACELAFDHPTLKNRLHFQIKAPDSWSYFLNTKLNC